MNDGVMVSELVRDAAGKPIDYRIIAVNSACEQILRMPAEKLLFKTAKEIFKSEKALHLEKFVDVMETGRSLCFESYFPSIRRHLRINAFQSENGMFASVFSDVSEQVTARRNLEKRITERNALLKELYHRTKNNLQLVSGLIVLELEQLEDEKHREIFSSLERKIQGIAVVHRKLYESQTLERIDLKEYIEELAPSVVSSIVSRKETVQIQLDCVSLEAGIDAAIAIGLIVNELLHNAVKYAVPNGAEKVRVALSRRKNSIELSVSDDGPGLPADFDQRRAHSTGIELAETLVRERLKGTLSFSNERGALCRAVFPAAALD